MGVKQRQQRRRARLFAENPFCPDCGVKMILPDDIPKITDPHEKGQLGNLKFHPDNLCTIEHHVTRFEPDKRRDNKEWTMIVCKRCNEKRGRAKELELGIDVLRERSNNLNKER